MTVLWLCSDPIPDQWQTAAHAVVRVLSPEEAHRAIGQEFPELVVVGEAEWAQEWVRVFPRDTRPAIVALGFGARTIAASADDWMLPTQSASELAEQPQDRVPARQAPTSTRSTRHGRSTDEPTQSPRRDLRKFSAEQQGPGVRGRHSPSY
jgi:hypothetical protein